MNPAEAVESTVYKHLSTSYTSKCQSEHSKIVRIPLDLKPIGFDGRIAYILENVFTPEECEKLIQHTEELGYGPALIHFGNQAVLSKGYRDSERVMVDDKHFVKILLQRIEKHLPQTFKNSEFANPYRLLEINERLRFLKYGPGDQFKSHYDGQYERPDGSARTWITLQIYLNGEMEGGETTFLAVASPEKQLKPENRLPVKPKTGMILVFQHNILHEGSLVTKGQKYTIRTDVLYEVEEEEEEEDGKV